MLIKARTCLQGVCVLRIHGEPIHSVQRRGEVTRGFEMPLQREQRVRGGASTWSPQEQILPGAPWIRPAPQSQRRQALFQ